MTVPGTGGVGSSRAHVRSLGIVGAGRVGTALARLALASGLEVVVAGSGDPERTAARLRLEAPGARAGDMHDAAAADVTILAIPLGRFRELNARALAGALVVDAMNYWWELDGARPDLDDPTTSTSETVQRHLHESRVVKAMGHMSLYELEHLAFPVGHPERRGAAVAGDAPDDVQVVCALVDLLGFDPVRAGALADGIRFEPGTEAFGADESADELAAMLERFWDSQRGRVVSRARGTR